MTLFYLHSVIVLKQKICPLYNTRCFNIHDSVIFRYWLLLLKLASSAKEWELDSHTPSETFFNQEVKQYIESICTLTDCTHVH